MKNIHFMQIPFINAIIFTFFIFFNNQAIQATTDNTHVARKEKLVLEKKILNLAELSSFISYVKSCEMTQKNYEISKKNNNSEEVYPFSNKEKEFLEKTKLDIKKKVKELEHEKNPFDENYFKKYSKKEGIESFLKEFKKYFEENIKLEVVDEGSILLGEISKILNDHFFNHVKKEWKNFDERSSILKYYFSSLEKVDIQSQNLGEVKTISLFALLKMEEKIKD